LTRGNINNSEGNTIANQLPSEDLTSVYGISYTDFNFSGEYDDSKVWLQNESTIIHGWSRNDNIFYSIVIPSFLGFRHFMIANVITEDIIWEDTWLPQRNEFMDTKASLSEIVNRFNIESNIGVIGEFPFEWNDYIYEIFVSYEIQLPSEHRLGEYVISLYLRRSDGLEKKLTPCYLLYSISDDPLNELGSIFIPLFKYIKNPFENKIAVIILLPRLPHTGYEYLYRPIFKGCDLDIGFN
jgi:hypothetical protein